MAVLRGRIIEFYSWKGVPGVLVSANGSTTVTDSQGNYVMNVAQGNMAITVMHRDFAPYTDNLNVPLNMDYILDDIVIRQTMVRAL